MSLCHKPFVALRVAEAFDGARRVDHVRGEQERRDDVDLRALNVGTRFAPALLQAGESPDELVARPPKAPVLQGVSDRSPGGRVGVVVPMERRDELADDAIVGVNGEAHPATVPPRSRL